MKYAQLTDVLNFSWDQLASAFWHRYPNPKSTHVIAEDTFHREILKNGVLFSKRLVKKRNHVQLPSWGEAIAPKYVYVIEESLVDPKRKTITSYTRNITSQSYCTVDEKVVYKPDADKRNISLLREVFVVSPVRFIGSAIQSILVSRYKSKTGPESTSGFSHVLTKFYRPWEMQIEHKATAKAKELLKESKEKLKESKELLKDKKEKSKEKLYESKEKLKESRVKLKETAHHAKEKSRETLCESRDKMKERAHEAANRAKNRACLDPAK